MSWFHLIRSFDILMISCISRQSNNLITYIFLDLDSHWQKVHTLLVRDLLNGIIWPKNFVQTILALNCFMIVDHLWFVNIIITTKTTMQFLLAFTPYNIRPMYHIFLNGLLTQWWVHIAIWYFSTIPNKSKYLVLFFLFLIPNINFLVTTSIAGFCHNCPNKKNIQHFKKQWYETF